MAVAAARPAEPTSVLRRYGLALLAAVALVGADQAAQGGLSVGLVNALRGWTPLGLAAHRGDARLVRRLLADHHASDHQTRDGWTPLQAAAHAGHAAAARELLKDPLTRVNAVNDAGWSATFAAAAAGHESVLHVLLETKSVKVALAERGGATPLFVASQQGHAAVVQQLLQDGRSDVNAPMKTGSLHSPLTIAASMGHDAVLELLLAHGADPMHAALPSDGPFPTKGGTFEDLRRERLR